MIGLIQVYNKHVKKIYSIWSGGVKWVTPDLISHSKYYNNKIIFTVYLSNAS